MNGAVAVDFVRLLDFSLSRNSILRMASEQAITLLEYARREPHIYLYESTGHSR